MLVLSKNSKGLFSCLLVLLALFLNKANAQTRNAVELYTKPMKDSIVLRWQIYNSQIWEISLKNGFDIYRSTIGSVPVKINDSIVKALDPNQFTLRYLTLPNSIDTSKIDYNKEGDVIPDTLGFSYKPDSIAQKAMALLFSDEVGLNFTLPDKESNMYFGDDVIPVRWLFHSLICFSSKEAAIISGMYFVDKNVKSNTDYTYYLVPKGKTVKEAVAIKSQNSSATYSLPSPRGIQDRTNKKRTTLSWKKIDTLGLFIPSYEVYRSEQKTSGYIKNNLQPVLALYEGPSIADTTIVTYSDTTLKKDKTYFYKVRGLDVFGDYTPFSDAYQVTEKTLLTYAPIIHELYKFGSPVQTRVKFTIDTVEVKNILELQLYKSTKPDTLYKRVPEKLKVTARDYVDKSPSKNNYYKLLMIGKAGDSLWSNVAYVLVPDSIPPKAPEIYFGVCDSLGIVTIKWRHSNESDLYGYALYFANQKEDEYSRIRNVISIDTITKDTISLRVLNSALYYKVVLFDESFNNSAFSNAFKVTRYDTIVPNNAVFVSFVTDKKGVNLVWANSSSEDVVKTTLYRRFKGELSWHVLKVFAQDTVKYKKFIDTAVVKGQWYEYKLQTTDDDGLVSNNESTLTVRSFDDGIRPGVENIQVKSSTKKRIVKLTWTNTASGVKNIQIYRGDEKTKPIILKALKAGSINFYDKDLAPGKTYTYLIKVEYVDGGESLFSRPIVVKMK